MSKKTAEHYNGQALQPGSLEERKSLEQYEQAWAMPAAWPTQLAATAVPPDLEPLPALVSSNSEILVYDYRARSFAPSAGVTVFNTYDECRNAMITCGNGQVKNLQSAAVALVKSLERLKTARAVEFPTALVTQLEEPQPERAKLSPPPKRNQK